MVLKSAIDLPMWVVEERNICLNCGSPKTSLETLEDILKRQSGMGELILRIKVELGIG